MFYSQSTGGFYEPEIHGANIPADAVEVSKERHAELLAAQSAGKCITPDAEGHPQGTDPMPPAFAALKDAELNKFRADRELFINRLDGIAGRYARANEAATAAACDTVIEGMLGLTTYPSVTAATDLDSLKMAMKARYAAILSGVPAVVLTAFKQVDV